MIDRGLLSNVGNYLARIIQDKDKVAKPTTELNEILRLCCDEEFEKKTYQEFKKIHCNMQVWGSRQAIDGLKEILNKLITHSKIIKQILQELTDIGYTDFNIEFTKKKLRRRIQLLDKSIHDYEMSWLERSLTISDQKQYVAPIWIEMQSEDISALVRHSFSDALLVLKWEGYPRRLSLHDLVLVLEMYGREGVDGSAGEEICKRICVEVCRRVTDDIVIEFDSEVEYINEFFKKYSPECYVRLNSMIHINFEDKKAAFIKIYTAMRDAEKTGGKNNFLAARENILGKEFIRQVIDDAIHNPLERTAKAWDLTKLHYKSCTLHNETMMNSVFKWCFEHGGFFKRSNATGTTMYSSKALVGVNLTLEQLLGGSEESRRGIIRNRIGVA